MGLLEVLAAVPPRADARRSAPVASYAFGDLTSETARRAYEEMLAMAGMGGTATRSMLPDSVNQYVPDWLAQGGDYGLAGLTGLLGAAETGAGALGEGVEAVQRGLGIDGRYAPGGSARALQSDLMGMLEGSGFAPEGRMLAGLADAAQPMARAGVMDFAADEFGGVGFKAYHGSPHDFDKFSMDKIGTGEGAQAYGHGLYFAEDDAVARAYQRNLSPAAHPSAPQDGGVRKNSYGQWVVDLNGGGVGGKYKTKREATEALAAMQATYPKGRLYEVQISADPEAFLDWDKPLSEQPQAVRDAFSGVAPNTAANPRGDMGYMLNEAANEVASRDGSWAQAANKANVTSPLREKGIPGIKYLDAGSRTAGDGSRNYVVFDDAMIEILRKYGLLAPAVGAGAWAAGSPTSAQAAPSGLLEDRR